MKTKTWLPFEEARDMAKSLELKNNREWFEYCKSSKKIDNIPYHPEREYKNQWIDWYDWLGVKRPEKLLSFKAAKEFTQQLGLKNGREWFEYCTSGFKPENIPSYPMSVYKNEWINWNDWLGKKSNLLYITHPEIFVQINLNKVDENIDLNKINSRSSKKLPFICNKCKREWVAVISSRTGLCTGCPFCSHRKVCLDNCLATTYPEIAKEWHFVKNGDLTPYNVMGGSGIKVWWIDKYGHEWQAVICDRTGKDKTGCPRCNESKGEKEIARVLGTLKISYINEYRINECRYKLPLPFDFFVNNQFLIEYNGEYHYEQFNRNDLESIQKRDQIKLDYCKSNNIPLLIIPYWEFNNIETLIKEFIQLNPSFSS